MYSCSHNSSGQNLNYSQKIQKNQPKTSFSQDLNSANFFIQLPRPLNTTNDSSDGYSSDLSRSPALISLRKNSLTMPTRSSNSQLLNLPNLHASIQSHDSSSKHSSPRFQTVDNWYNHQKPNQNNHNNDQHQNYNIPTISFDQVSLNSPVHHFMNNQECSPTNIQQKDEQNQVMIRLVNQNCELKSQVECLRKENVRMQQLIQMIDIRHKYMMPMTTLMSHKKRKSKHSSFPMKEIHTLNEQTDSKTSNTVESI